MISRQVVLRNACGLHARPASEFVARARSFVCDVRVGRASDGVEVDAKNPMRLLSANLSHGDVLDVVCDGPDEESAVAELVEYLSLLG